MGPFGLSCNHVLNPLIATATITHIIQPGADDGGVYPYDFVGYLHDFVPMYPNTPVTVDAAIFSCLQPSIISDKIVDVNITPMSPRDVNWENWGEGVHKVGRTTGLTYGKISEIIATVKVDNYIYQDVFGVTSDTYFPELDAYTFAWPGDSGSLVLSDIDDKPLGLVFAGGRIAPASERYVTYCCKAVNIERELDIIFALPPSTGPEERFSWTGTWISMVLE
jgi:hypothetical protein